VLYDVFISHASEDKDEFVRPLAELLREQHLEVWYDEFSLNVGDSLRRSIDCGLSQSRYGIVVLSPSFFRKQWSQWELDGLVARQNSGDAQVLLPVWHNIGRDEVLAYSPPLADRVAVPSSVGLDNVVDRLARVIRPQGSTLVHARDYLIDMGTNPPVISDDWWLDIAAAAESNPMEGDFQEAMGWGRWGFPLPPQSTEPSGRGLRLAWAALQRDWQREAELRSITQITRPDVVAEFIASQPGLAETCHDFVRYVAVYAPQLTIPGFGGEFEDEIDAMYRLPMERGHGCDDDFALRDPDFGGYDAANIACGFVQGHAVMNGPPVKFYEHADYVAWLLSDDSQWLPERIRAFLTSGMAQWAVWPWHRSARTEREFGFQPAPYTGKLFDALYRARRLETFKLGRDARKDLEHRLGFSGQLLKLPESGEELADRFLTARFIDGFFTDRRKRRG
jgi:hypothetical protein